MNIKQDVFLSEYTTLRIGGQVRYFIECTTDADIVDAMVYADNHNLPVLLLGGGSNMVIADHAHNMICIHMVNTSLDIVYEDESSVHISVGAGYLWDDFVEYAVSHGYAGIEALSAIPGTCGATPVQNVGAYGQEVSETIVSVRAYNTVSGIFLVFSNTDCQFGYRDSIFKHAPRGTYIIESVVFKLDKKSPSIPRYPRVSDELGLMQEHYPHESQLMHIRRAIQKIRSDKLPNPHYVPNVGSFFKNVYVNSKKFSELQRQFVAMPFFQEGGMYKIPTGWLIESVGLKGYSRGGVGVYDKNALVLINQSSVNSRDILSLAEEIHREVSRKFGLAIEIEPEIVP